VVAKSFERLEIWIIFMTTEAFDLFFITISAVTINGTFTGTVGVLKLTSGEWHMDLVAIAFYLFAIQRLIVYGFIILYVVASI